MSDKFVLVSLDDTRTKNIADAITNKSCKKILDYLAEVKEASASDLSEALKMPINTIHYSLDKLIKSELLEKSRNFFWSVKGKKIDMYKVSRKSIVISPRSKVITGIKSILPAAIISGLFAILLRYIMIAKTFAVKTMPVFLDEQIVATATETISQDMAMATDFAPVGFIPAWIWFLAGAGFALIAFLVINLVRRRSK